MKMLYIYFLINGKFFCDSFPPFPSYFIRSCRLLSSQTRGLAQAKNFIKNLFNNAVVAEYFTLARVLEANIIIFVQKKEENFKRNALELWSFWSFWGLQSLKNYTDACWPSMKFEMSKDFLGGDFKNISDVQSFEVYLKLVLCVFFATRSFMCANLLESLKRHKLFADTQKDVLPGNFSLN